MSVENKNEEIVATAAENDDIKTRRDFLRSLGKWSAIIIGGAVLGGVVETNNAAGWVNGGGGAGWVNARGGGGGAAWVNHSGGGAAWVNRAGGWINGVVVGGGGGGAGWINARGGGGGAAWVNRH